MVSKLMLGSIEELPKGFNRDNVIHNGQYSIPMSLMNLPNVTILQLLSLTSTKLANSIEQ